MFKKNKLLLMIVAILVIALAAGCAGPAPEQQTEPTEKIEKSEPAEITSGDESKAIEALVDDYFADKPSHNYKIKQDAFIEKVKNGEDMFVLDIRQPDVYTEGHIAGAVNAPWGTAISENMDKLPMDKPVYVYCYTGQTAGQTVALLNFAGFEAYSVNLGWNLGISKVNGVKDVTVKEASDFDKSAASEIDGDIMASVTDYFEGLADVKDTMFKNYNISEDNLKSLIEEKDDGIYILSIRGADDFESGHIARAFNIPWAAGMQESFNTIPKDKTVVVYCYTGQTAGQTTAALRMMGYDAVSLNGGMGMAANDPYGWSNKGFDVYEGEGLEGIVNKYFAEKPDNNYKIKQGDFIEKVKSGEDMFVLDIRQPDVYAEGHIEGAVNAPWGTDISDNLDMIPSDKPVYVYCYTGQTAGQTVALLNFAGIDAKSVNLGWNLGISKVEAYEEAVTSEVFDFGPAKAADYNYEIESAIEMYYGGLAEAAEGIYKNYKISEDNLKAILDDDPSSIYVLSIRSAKAFDEGHIPTAFNIPWAAGMQEAFPTLNNDKTTVVYCYTGQTAGQTTAALRILGYDAVSLNGGMGMEANAPYGWTNKAYETVK